MSPTLPAPPVVVGSLESLPVSESRPRIVPEATVARLAVYLRVLAGVADGGRTHPPSGELASAAGVNPAGLRKDLSHLGPCGVRGVGYSVAGLRDRLTEVLGGEHSRACVLVGIGRLGSALADYSGFASRGFQFVALLDADPQPPAPRASPVRPPAAPRPGGGGGAGGRAHGAPGRRPRGRRRRQPGL